MSGQCGSQYLRKVSTYRSSIWFLAIYRTPLSGRYVSVVLIVGELGTSVVGQDFRKTDPATPRAFLITLNRLK